MRLAQTQNNYNQMNNNNSLTIKNKSKINLKCHRIKKVLLKRQSHLMTDMPLLQATVNVIHLKSKNSEN